MTQQDRFPRKIYFRSVFAGILLNLLLITLVVTIFHFEYKSAVCLYLWGFIGYTLKAFLFFTPYFLIKSTANKSLNVIIGLTPAFLYVIWFALIIFMQVQVFYVDLEFGYIQRFPHFLLQLLSVLLIVMVSSISIYRSAKNA